MRKPIIVANWKMHKTLEEALFFVDTPIGKQLTNKIEVSIFAPFVYLSLLREKLSGTGVSVGAQNVYWEEEGAYTGEISPYMLASLGVKYAIVGHSERRLYFNETDEMVNKKLKAVYKASLSPILCVGETLHEREEGRTASTLLKQISSALADISPEEIERLVVAYEPVWAIGTGQAATPCDAQDSISLIRETIATICGSKVASKVRIQYGGSVTEDNIVSFIKKKDIDGALVGGASLNPNSFNRLLSEVKNVVSQS